MSERLGHSILYGETHELTAENTTLRRFLGSRALFNHVAIGDEEQTRLWQFFHPETYGYISQQLEQQREQPSVDTDTITAFTNDFNRLMAHKER